MDGQQNGISAVRAVFFSPTGTTKEITTFIAGKLAAGLNVPLLQSSYTLPKERELFISEAHFMPGELVVWGTPTYAGRIPNKTLDFVTSILTGDPAGQNSGNLMIPVAVYGNRSFDNCLAELAGLMQKGGSIPFAGIAAPSRHTFSSVLGAGRPDSADYQKLEAYCDRILARLRNIGPSANIPEFPGEAEPEKYYTPRRADGEPAKFLKAKPQVRTDKCNGCGTCEGVCPMGSISMGGEGLAEAQPQPQSQPQFEGVCIKCQACIRSCPEGALYFDDPDFLSHVEMLEQNFTKQRKEPELFISEM